LGETNQPSVIPLQAHAILDPNASNISDEQLLAHALRNTSRTVDEHYAVKHGSTFINEYGRKDETGALFIGKHDNPNHLLGAFPCLFPYGMGGFEVQRPHPLSYESHARWSMRYADRRFRTDIQFMFQVFGVLQKRQVCRSAVLQIKKEDFVAHQESFRHLQPADLLKASKEENKNMPVSNPTIRSLKHHLSAIRSKVKGTDESRTSIRSQIWGMSVMKGPPSLWITINPTDTHDPIAQVFTGAEIDLDKFNSDSGPNASEHAVRIANDPYAAARFFHFIIKTILSELFGVIPAHHSTLTVLFNQLFHSF
jgi:hypothetical protein